MAKRYLSELFTPAVRSAQEHYYQRSMEPTPSGARDRLGDAEIEFIETRDSFYMATASTDGWPYLQHRGGPPGFLSVVNGDTLAFADFRGNRQLITTGNLAANQRTSLFLMDYPRRLRLKILAHATVHDARDHPDLVERVAPAALARRTERIVSLAVIGYDWNCAAYITPRFTEAELREALASGWQP